MIQALNDAAFSPYMTPDGLWRASCSWAASGGTEHAEWLHEMAVDLIDIEQLPEYTGRTQDHQLALPPARVRITQQQQNDVVEMTLDPRDDIPF